jgi:hypothetical protein
MPGLPMLTSVKGKRTIGVVAAVALSMALTSCGAKSVTGCRVRSVAKAPYVAKNETIFRQLPGFHGSELLSSYSPGQPASDSCFPLDNGPPYWSFVTTRSYSRPEHTAVGAIVRFYRKRLAPEWQLRGYAAATPPRDSTFRRGAAQVYVSESERGWSLTVDHAAYRSPKP